MAPGQWANNLIANYSGDSLTTISQVTASAIGVVPIPYDWYVPQNPDPSTPDLNHYCLVCEVLADNESLALPADFSLWSDFIAWINSSSCLGFRNLMSINNVGQSPSFLQLYRYQNLSGNVAPMIFTATWFNLPVNTVVQLYDGTAGVDSSTMVSAGEASSGILTAGGEVPANYSGQLQVAVTVPSSVSIPSDFAMTVSMNLFYNPVSEYPVVREAAARDPALAQLRHVTKARPQRVSHFGNEMGLLYLLGQVNFNAATEVV
jgi:hypothetical protein